MTELNTDDQTMTRALRDLADAGLDERVQREIESRVDARLQRRADGGGRDGRFAGLGRRRRRTAFGLAVVASLLTAVALVGTGSTGAGLDAVAEAKAALDPAHGILHMVVTTRSGTGAAGSPKTVDRTEIWTASSPPRWRSRRDVTPSPPGARAGYVRDGRFVTARGIVQQSYAHGSAKTYRSQFDELEILTGIPDRAPTADGPGVLQLRGHDPGRSLRAQLADGDVRDTGEVVAGGRRVRRLVGVTHERRFVTRTLVYDVDPDTFAPVQGSLTVADTRPGRSGQETFTVDRYERLLDSPANAKLLVIPTGAHTKVSRRPAILPRYLRR